MDDNYCINPLWAIRGGFFARVDWGVAPRSEEASEMIAAIAANPVFPNATVFLRGSLLEYRRPFVGADADLLVVHHGARREPAHAPPRWSPRPLDIHHMGDDAMQTDPVYFALLALRSLRVSGPEVAFPPVAVDEEFVLAHWLKYSPFLLPDEMSTQCWYSIPAMKQLIRSFGILRLLRCGEYSRDINLCMRWAAEEDERLAAGLEMFRRRAEAGEHASFDIKAIKAALVRSYESNYCSFQERVRHTAVNVSRCIDAMHV